MEQIIERSDLDREFERLYISLQNKYSGKYGLGFKVDEFIKACKETNFCYLTNEPFESRSRHYFIDEDVVDGELLTIGENFHLCDYHAALFFKQELEDLKIEKENLEKEKKRLEKIKQADF